MSDFFSDIMKNGALDSLTADQLDELILRAQAIRSEQQNGKEETRIDACPHCGSIAIKKHGTTSKGSIRMICKDCGKTFTLSENLSLTEGTQGNPVNLNGTFTAAVSIPLTGFIPYSSSNLALKKLEDQVESAEDTLALTIKETQNSLSLLPDKLARLWDAIGLAEMNYSISQKAYQLSEEGYESGLVSQTDLNTARQQLTTAQQSLYETQRDYLSALYDAALLMNISVEELITQYGGNHDGR